MVGCARVVVRCKQTLDCQASSAQIPSESCFVCSRPNVIHVRGALHSQVVGGQGQQMQLDPAAGPDRGMK